MYIRKVKRKNEDGKIVNYIYVESLSDVEFARDFLSKDGYINVFSSLKNFVQKHFKKEDTAILVINGVLIGTITLGIFFKNNEQQVQNKLSDNIGYSKIEQTVAKVGEIEDIKLNEKDENIEIEKNINNNIETNLKNNDEIKILENNNNINNVSNNKIAENNNINNIQEKNSYSPTPNIAQNNSNIAQNTDAPKTPEQVLPTNTIAPSETKALEQTVAPTPSDYVIKLNNNGNILNLNLEEYIIGVVAAEMPASFNVEALKAQAVAARTYAVKKTQSGKTLVNSSSDQVYNTTAQMQAKWGQEYNYYYNRVKNAVEATKCEVLMYNRNIYRSIVSFYK